MMAMGRLITSTKRGVMKPVGEWNTEVITAKGKQITVVLNSVTVTDCDLSQAIKSGTADKKEHSGIERSEGHIGLLGWDSTVEFRNIRIKDLAEHKK